jgi:hypothetical protein
MQPNSTKHTESTPKDDALRRLWNQDVSDISESEMSDALDIFRNRRTTYNRTKRRKLRVLSIMKYAALFIAPIITAFDVKLSEKFSVHTSLAYINNKYEDPTNSYVGGGSDQIIRQVNLFAPWVPYKNEDGTYGTLGDGNPIAWLDLDQTIYLTFWNIKLCQLRFLYMIFCRIIPSNKSGDYRRNE